MNNKVFSEYEIKEMSIRFEQEEESHRAGCVGSVEETLNSKTITKKCEGIESVVAVKGTGTGEVKVSIHMSYEIYNKIYGMNLETLIKGVVAYGQNSIHKRFAITGKVYDEEGNCKLKAYPNCILKDGVSRKIENGAEEIAEIEMTISINPDEEGNGMYEAYISDLDEGKEETLVDEWMTNFKYDLVKSIAA